MIDRAILSLRYEAALREVPPLPRTVFLMHRLDNLTYWQIADQLAIGPKMVETCQCEALVIIANHVGGLNLKRRVEATDEQMWCRR